MPFQDFLMQNPIALQAYSEIQGYGGQSRPLSMAEAALASQNYREEARQQQVEQALPAVMSQVQGASPEEAFAILAPVIGPESAIKYAEQLRIQKNQQFMQDLLSGGGQGGAGMAAGGGLSNLPDERLVMMAGIDGPPGEMAKAELTRRQQQRTFDAGRADRTADEQFRSDNEAQKRAGSMDDRYSKQIEPLSTIIDDYNASIDLAKQDDAASDYQLIKMGVQAYDKRASAVTDEEFAQQLNSGSFVTTVKRLVGQYAYGDKLTPDQRKSLLEAIKIRAEQNRGKIDKINTAFEKKAQSQGVDFTTIKEGYDPGKLRDINEAFQPAGQEPVSLSDSVPTFTGPDDPAYQQAPSGTQFYGPSGKLFTKP